MTDDLAIRKIIALITSGHSFRCGTYDLSSTRSFAKSYVKGVSLIALDFDETPHTPEQLVAHSMEIGFAPNFWYYSFSQNKKPNYNFRLVWVLRDVITVSAYESLYKALLTAYAPYSPDVSTKDASRLWYGTNNGARLIKDTFTEKSDLGIITTAFELSEGAQLGKIKSNKKLFIKDYTDKPEPTSIPVKSDWKIALRAVCPLWRQWCDGKYLNYNQRLALFVNLRYIEFDSKVKTILSSCAKPETYQNHTFNESQLIQLLRAKLCPVPICNLNGESLTVRDFFEKYSKTTQLTQTPKLTVAQLDNLLDKRIPELLSSNRTIYIKAQTASGKTQRIIDYLCRKGLLNMRKIIYSAPTFQGLCEFEQRFRIAYKAVYPTVPPTEVPIQCVPAQSNLTPRDLLLLSIGLPKETRDSVRAAAINNAIQSESGLFLMTHQLLANCGAAIKASCIIIDENIENALITRSTISKAQLSSVLLDMDDTAAASVREIAQRIDEMPFGSRIDISAFRALLSKEHFDLESYLESDNLASGLFYLAQPDFSAFKGKAGNSWAIRLSAIAPLLQHCFTNETPIKFFTATSQKALLDAYTERLGRIDYYEFPLASNEGRIVQYLGQTGAKGRDCEKIKDMIDYIKHSLPDWADYYVITFKDAIEIFRANGFKIPFENGNAIHLTNNAGLDFLKGRKVIVAGKFDLPDTEYSNIWYEIRKPNEPLEITRKHTTIFENGYLQSLFLFDEPAIQQIQLQQIRQAIEQSAGRARALRIAGAQVAVFANYIFPDVDEVKQS